MAVTYLPKPDAARAGDDQQRRHEAERRALANLVVRLRNSVPEVPEREVEATVRNGYASFDRSRVRDFITVLVERRARQQLRDRRAS